MRINFDRLSKLAGLPSSGRRLNEAYEGAGHSDEEVNEADYLQELEGQDEADDIDPTSFMEDEEKDAKEGDEGHDESMLEIDEVMLVQELRRAKKMMQESRRRKSKKSSLTALQEAQLKRVIDEEVRNVMNDLNLTSGWVYGDNKPKRSRHGYSHQGSYLKGLGFK